MYQLKGYCFHGHGNRAELNDEYIKKKKKKQVLHTEERFLKYYLKLLGRWH